MSKIAKTRKFVVRAHSAIIIEGPDGLPMKCTGGTVVSLTAKLAKHFHGHGRLDPYMEDFDDAEEAETKTNEET